MANFKSLGAKGRMVRLGVALALCVPLVLLTQGNQGKGNKGKKNQNCQTVTADAVFRDDASDGILSDGEFSSIYNDKKYYGLEDTLVCLLKEQDHDLILSTAGKTQYERASGVDRKVTLDFLANNLNLPPFDPDLVTDVLIRVDEVLSDTNYADMEKRFLLWFDIGRDHYQLRFDGTDCDLVWVTQSRESPNRIWTIESTGDHTAWLVKLKGVSRKTTVDYFIMPFKITVTERQDKDPTCL